MKFFYQHIYTELNYLTMGVTYCNYANFCSFFVMLPLVWYIYTWIICALYLAGLTIYSCGILKRYFIIYSKWLPIQFGWFLSNLVAVTLPANLAYRLLLGLEVEAGWPEWCENIASCHSLVVVAIYDFMAGWEWDTIERLSRLKSRVYGGVELLCERASEP